MSWRMRKVLIYTISCVVLAANVSLGFLDDSSKCETIDSFEKGFNETQKAAFRESAEGKRILNLLEECVTLDNETGNSNYLAYRLRISSTTFFIIGVFLPIFSVWLGGTCFLYRYKGELGHTKPGKAMVRLPV